MRTHRSGEKHFAIASLSPVYRSLLSVFMAIICSVYLQVAIANPSGGGAPISAVVAVGLGGTSEYREMFEEAATEMTDQLLGASDSSDTGAAAGDPSTVVLLLEDKTDRETLLDHIDERVEFIVSQSKLGQTHRFVLAMFGHGSFDGEDYKFNISGPDVTARELAEHLKPLDGMPQLLLLGTSASGAALEWLESDDRIVLTATKSGAESNVVLFPRFWKDTLLGSDADIDHDEQLSVQEAFDYTSQALAEHYENAQQLATEHPRIVIGANAQLSVLTRLGSLAGTESNPVVNTLLKERDTLESEFLDIRATRGQKPQTQYLDELEVVLLKIAQLQREIDSETGWGDDDQ